MVFTCFLVEFANAALLPIYKVIEPGPPTQKGSNNYININNYLS